MSGQPKPCKKVKFANKKYANEFLNRKKTKRPEQQNLMRAYYCRECNAFHITSRAYRYKLEEDNKNLQLQVKQLKNKLRSKHIELLSVKSVLLVNSHTNSCTESKVIKDLRNVLSMQKEQIEFYISELKEAKKK